MKKKNSNKGKKGGGGKSPKKKRLEVRKAHRKEAKTDGGMGICDTQWIDGWKMGGISFKGSMISGRRGRTGEWLGEGVVPQPATKKTRTEKKRESKIRQVGVLWGAETLPKKERISQTKGRMKKKKRPLLKGLQKKRGGTVTIRETPDEHRALGGEKAPVAFGEQFKKKNKVESKERQKQKQWKGFKGGGEKRWEMKTGI